MKREKAIVGFIGAGGIAQAHAFSLNSLNYYYIDSPDPELEAVCSATSKSRDFFANRYRFKKPSTLKDFLKNDRIDTVYILGPNKVHFEHLKAAVKMPAIKRIYIEKPVCSTFEEELHISELLKDYPKIKIQVGYQYHFMASVREAFAFWKTGILGKPVHFDLKYFHGDYLQKEYRNRRTTRLTSAPDGGAMADLGSHAISLLISFLGNDMEITGAIQAGQFKDVIYSSDLFSMITLYDKNSGAAGSLSASRISSGTADTLSMELYAEKGTLRFSSRSAEYYEYFLEETGVWCRIRTGSNYKPITNFPSGHVAPGWLRSMIHAHYIFLTENDPKAFVPDISHGLNVQRLVRQTAERLSDFRDKVWKYI
jgi:predicted dehydrogenase